MVYPTREHGTRPCPSAQRSLVCQESAQRLAAGLLKVISGQRSFIEELSRDLRSKSTATVPTKVLYFHPRRGMGGIAD